jgi:hypothetical protein
MIYANNKLFENHQSNCTKYEEYKSRIQQLKHDVTEKEDEYIFRYRHFEDAKGRDLRVIPKHGSVDIVT